MVRKRFGVTCVNRQIKIALFCFLLLIPIHFNKVYAQFFPYNEGTPICSPIDNSCPSVGVGCSRWYAKCVDWPILSSGVCAEGTSLPGGECNSGRTCDMAHIVKSAGFASGYVNVTACGAPDDNGVLTCNAGQSCVQWLISAGSCVRHSGCLAPTQDPCGPPSAIDCLDPQDHCVGILGAPQGYSGVCARCVTQSPPGNIVGVPCDDAAGLYCCDVAGNYECKGGANSVCVLLQQQTCGGRLAFWEVCDNDAECASHNCASQPAAPGQPTRCLPVIVGNLASCNPLFGNCGCVGVQDASGNSLTECAGDSTNGYFCVLPTQCVGPGGFCNGDANCCQQGLGLYGCSSVTGSCYKVQWCQMLGAPCTDNSQCCLANNLGCIGPAGNKTCLDAGTGDFCDGDSCGFPGGDCGLGEKCIGGRCAVDSNCAFGVNQYTGPIIDIDSLLSSIFSLLYPAALLLGMAFIAKAGYSYMTSEGNPQKVREAQEELTSAILGILFILLSVVILRVIIGSVLGVNVGF